MREDEVTTGMELMCPAGLVKVGEPVPNCLGWWQTEYLWTHNDPDPHPSKRFTAWHARDLRRPTLEDKPPKERSRDVSDLQGEWPRTLKGGRP